MGITDTITRRITHLWHPADLASYRAGERLRAAIHSGEVTVHYQPKVDSRTRRASSVEALVRWDHPTRGLLPPAAFLPLVEQAGLMPELTEAVLTQALDQVAGWRYAGRALSVAVNLPGSCVVDDDLPARVFALLDRRGLPGSCLELEITEDSLVDERDRAWAVLSQLRSRGIRVSVDDFGTGYSCLAYLRELPIDQLKLDRSLVLPLVHDPRAAAIVRSTIDLAHLLGVTVVAEGVEDEATARQLAQCGCDESQGFHFSRALSVTQLEGWLDERASQPSMAAA